MPKKNKLTDIEIMDGFKAVSKTNLKLTERAIQLTNQMNNNTAIVDRLNQEIHELKAILGIQTSADRLVTDNMVAKDSSEAKKIVEQALNNEKKH